MILVIILEKTTLINYALKCGRKIKINRDKMKNKIYRLLIKCNEQLSFLLFLLFFIYFMNNIDLITINIICKKNTKQKYDQKVLHDNFFNFYLHQNN